MLNSRECAEAWMQVNKIYDETISYNNPKITMTEIIAVLGKPVTTEVFATVAEIKKYDGRITPMNRKRLVGTEINPENAKWERGNRMLYADIDHIHTSHINNLLTELFGM